MTQTTDTDIREIKDLIATNTKAIADLTLEMRVGFSDMRGQINTVEAKLEGKIGKLDERTQLGFWGLSFGVKH
jgi:hypothetical protein